LPTVGFLINLLMGRCQGEAMFGNVAVNRARKANDKRISQSLAMIADAVDELCLEAASMEELARAVVEDQTLLGVYVNPAEVL
jgi:hypothetical protein